MSSVVFNVQNTTQQSQNSIEQLFPTTIGGATKMYQRYQHIMPAPEQHQQQQQSNIKSSNGLTIKTRKYTPRGMALATAATTGATATTATAATTMPYNVDQSQSVQRRNARERNRVKQVNNSFARLRQHIPQSIIADLTKGGGRGPHKKISKVDTLRIAVEYIRRLQDLVDDLNGGATTAATATTAGNHLNLCLDETSCSSGSSTHSSSNNSSHHMYSYNNHSNHSSSHSSSSSNHSNNLLQQQQQLQRQQFPNNPLTPITLNGNHLLQPFAATQQLQQQLLQQHQQQQQHQLQQLQQQQQQQQPQLATTTTTTGACHSPTSSFNSSMSFDSGTYEAAPQQLSPPAPASSSSSSSSSSNSNSSSSAALDAQLQLKFEPYEHFQLDEEDCTPDDEEILDYISLWQEQ